MPVYDEIACGTKGSSKIFTPLTTILPWRGGYVPEKQAKAAGRLENAVLLEGDRYRIGSPA